MKIIKRSPVQLEPKVQTMFKIISFGFAYSKTKSGCDRVLDGNGKYTRTDNGSVPFPLSTLLQQLYDPLHGYYIKRVMQLPSGIVYEVGDHVLSSKCFIPLRIDSFELLSEDSPYIFFRSGKFRFPLWSVTGEPDKTEDTSTVMSEDVRKAITPKVEVKPEVKPKVEQVINLNTDVLLRKNYPKCMYRVIIKDGYYRLENIAYATLYKHKAKVLNIKDTSISIETLNKITSRGMTEPKDFKVVSMVDIYNNCIDL